MKSPAGNARLFTVDAIATDDAWAAGHGAKGGPAVLIEHWDGSQWTKATVPSIPTPAGINDLTAVSGSNVWAVGWQAITGGSVPVRTLAEHWDGAAWKIVPTVDPAGARSNSLVSVSARSANDIWAVGYSLIGFSHQTLIEHWDGTTWSVVPSPNPGTYDVLLGVDAISSSDAWAVGYRDDGFGAATLVEHWDGMSWNVVQIHNAGTVQNVLADVTMVSSSNVWAVGYKSNGGNYRTLVEHWNGTSWRAIDSPNVGSSNMLLDVAFDSPADGWAVGGSYIRGGDDGYNGLIEHWDGTSWSVSTSPNSKATSDRLTAVAVVPSSGGMAWAVGSTQKAGLTEQYCGPGGSPMPSRDSSVRAAPSAVVGSSGRVDRSVARPDARTSVQTSSAQSVIAVDEADSAGIAQTTYTYGAAVDDYNNDGWPDFVYDRHFDPAGVYMNNKDGTFTQTAQFTGIWERLGCTSGDVNQDGLADVFCAIGNDWGTDLHGSELWIQQPDHSFIDQGGAYGVLDPTGRDRRGVFIDANHDGYPDLWLGTKAERPDGLPSPDRLLINVGGTKFVDAPQYGLDQEVSGGICGQAFDYNNDGYQDLMTCTDAGLFVYRNDGGQQFIDVTSSLSFMRYASDAQMVDLNGDGRLDMVGVDLKVLNVYVQRSDGSFHRSFKESDFTSGVWVAAGDVNSDSRPDLYVVQSHSGNPNAPDVMLINDGTGTSFTQMQVPETTVGDGDSAYPLDYDKNGLMDFLVMNGEHNAGPVQLIAFFPAGSARVAGG